MSKIDPQIMDALSAEYHFNGKIGKGGQATTFLLRRISDKQPFVLKQLRFQDRAKPRARMFIETNNLKALKSLGGNVPSLIFSNTDEYENKEVPLFLIMDYVEGETLDKLIERDGPLSIKNSISLINSLIPTIQIAHENHIIHRDIKPANIIVKKDFQSTLVDYGLSFNEEVISDLSPEGEKLDIKFLSLPEARMDNGDKRDQRTDITYLVGIFYYLLTGLEPGELITSGGKSPHRLHAELIEAMCENKFQFNSTMSFFDRGFKIDINNRFESIEEFASRLNNLLDLKATKETDLKELAKSTEANILKISPEIMLEHHKRILFRSFYLSKEIVQSISKKIQPFILAGKFRNPNPVLIFPKDKSFIPEFIMRLSLCLNYKQDIKVIFGYEVAIEKSEYLLMRYSGLFEKDPRRDKWTSLDEIQWEEVIRFSIEESLTKEFVIENIYEYIPRGMERISEYFANKSSD